MSFLKKMFPLKKRTSVNWIEERAHEEITAKMREEEDKQNKLVSLLLLGTGGSGKTTVLKQMHQLYKGIDEKEKEESVQMIRANILEDIYDLCTYNIVHRNNPLFQLSPSHKKICDTIAAVTSTLDEIGDEKELAKQIYDLWQDPGMKETYKIRSREQVMDNTPWMLDRIIEIFKDDYVVDIDAFLRARQRTIGVTHSEFNVLLDPNNASSQFKILVADVGGQRSERKKWIRCFSNVSAVVYVVALSGYYQYVFEDITQNSLTESLELFGNICNFSCFSSTDFIIFLNKSDVFLDLIRTVPITDYDKNGFKGDNPHDPDQVIEYIQQRFRALFKLDIAADNKQPSRSNSVSESNGYQWDESFMKHPSRNIYFYTTCATDSKQMKNVLDLMQINTVRSLLQKSGFA